jgi:hypothetical protein
MEKTIVTIEGSALYLLNRSSHHRGKDELDGESCVVRLLPGIVGLGKKPNRKK